MKRLSENTVEPENEHKKRSTKSHQSLYLILLLCLLLIPLFAFYSFGGVNNPEATNTPSDTKTKKTKKIAKTEKAEEIENIEQFENKAETENVTVIDTGTYFDVTLNYTTCASPSQIGKEYGSCIKQVFPGYEEMLDAYISDSFDELIYRVFLLRVGFIRTNVPTEYQEELDGFASVFSGGNTDTPGDGKLSRNELWILNLMTDVARGYACSAYAVWGDRSADGKNTAVRILDWYGGNPPALPRTQAIVKILNGEKSMCLIGYAGYMGVLTGFNKSGVFAGVLDSPVGSWYSSLGKRSYTFDLRKSLETATSIEDVSEFMTKKTRRYAFNHLVFVGDKKRSGVIENNFSGDGENIRRTLRYDESELNPNIKWGLSNAIGAVNSFMLLGNLDNHHGGHDVYRFETIRKGLQETDKIPISQLRAIATNKSASKESNGMYNSITQQIVIFQPGNNYFEMFFCPRNGHQPDNPTFVRVNVNLE